MTSRTIMLNRIKEYCFMHCKLCTESSRDNLINQTCPLYPFKDGKVPEQYKKKMTETQLANLSKSPRNGKTLISKSSAAEASATTSLTNNQ